MTANESSRGSLAGCWSVLCEAPPTLAQTRRWHRKVDRFLFVSRPAIVPVSVALGLAASAVADALPARVALLPAAVFFALVGGWCSLNFSRCREAHCVVTGIGYDGLAVAAAVAFALDRHWSGPLWIAALLVLAAGAGFEAAWASARGSSAVRSTKSLDRA